MNNFESPVINPCPECGNIPIIKSRRFPDKEGIFAGQEYYYAKCSFCGRQGTAFLDKQEAIKSWNMDAENGV